MTALGDREAEDAARSIVRSINAMGGRLQIRARDSIHLVGSDALGRRTRIEVDDWQHLVGMSSALWSECKNGGASKS